MTTFAIVSAYNHGASPILNVIAHDDLVRDHVRPLPYVFRQVTGCWKGVTEQSVQIFKPEDMDLHGFITEMRDLGKLFDQECVLVVHDDLSANLIYPEFVEAIPGEWQPLALLDASRADSWTFIDGDFYGVQ